MEERATITKGRCSLKTQLKFGFLGCLFVLMGLLTQGCAGCRPIACGIINALRGGMEGSPGCGDQGIVYVQVQQPCDGQPVPAVGAIGSYSYQYRGDTSCYVA